MLIDFYWRAMLSQIGKAPGVGGSKLETRFQGFLSPQTGEETEKEPRGQYSGPSSIRPKM